MGSDSVHSTSKQISKESVNKDRKLQALDLLQRRIITMPVAATVML